MGSVSDKDCLNEQVGKFLIVCALNKNFKKQNKPKENPELLYTASSGLCFDLEEFFSKMVLRVFRQ